MIATLFNPEKGFWVLCCFLGFFAVVVGVNSVFITTALSTHSGVITDQPYEKGLAYDAMKDAASSQPEIIQTASFENGILRWTLFHPDDTPIEADVTVRLVWPVKDGYDFETSLKHIAPGVYEAAPAFPLKGRWSAQLKAVWTDNTQYQTRMT